MSIIEISKCYFKDYQRHFHLSAYLDTDYEVVSSPVWCRGLCRTSFLQLEGHRLAVLLVYCQVQPSSHTAAEIRAYINTSVNHCNSSQQRYVPATASDKKHINANTSCEHCICRAPSPTCEQVTRCWVRVEESKQASTFSTPALSSM